MIKLFRFLLPICIFLLSGFTQQNTHAYNESIHFSSTKNPEGLVFNNFVSLTGCQDLSAKTLLSDSKSENGENHTAKLEEKEDELTPFKKYIDISNGFTSAFYITASGYFSHYTKQYLFFNKHFSYFPFYRSLYLKFNVFRI